MRTSTQHGKNGLQFYRDLPRTKGLAAAVIRACIFSSQAFNPQALSNCLWALVSLRYNPGDRCLRLCASRMQETLCEHTCQVMHQFYPFRAAVAPHAANQATACFVKGLDHQCLACQLSQAVARASHLADVNVYPRKCAENWRLCPATGLGIDAVRIRHLRPRASTAACVGRARASLCVGG